ncbi:protein smf [Legionella santicrucis]|uniref:Protein smf n=1 Tax=Legionella santicrucis TaxID=45074 RepID=A0A0W0ZBS3_9GAMM|nr:DNA-processing protein DprA [Legionella santicrucis]KTD66489.1 protein smf [Legionella santicrucis]
MNAQLNLSIDEDSISPSIEIGAFEALWSNRETNISSFKQLRERLDALSAKLPSALVDTETALSFYKKAIGRLKECGINNFGIKIDGTFDFPTKLHDADYPLALLYYIGNWDLVFTRGVSVVGTRNPSLNGIKRTQKLVKGLIDQGFTIFSGLAKGIDTTAHQTAIEYGGQTVAVIGTPLCVHYPKENTALQERIAKEFLLISQVPIVSYENKDIKFNRIFFPERNKTMSALSEATIIVEAGETSGSLIQARAALKQNRKVFILNNNFENPKLTWPNRLLEAGAFRIHSLDDILQELQ